MGTHKSYWLSSRLMIGSIYPTHINNKVFLFIRIKMTILKIVIMVSGQMCMEKELTLRQDSTDKYQ